MTDQTADALVVEARRAVHESLTLLPAWEADRVRALIADLETAVEGRTAIRFTVPAPATDQNALRDRIAEALRYWVHPTDRGTAADAVLAVLPATVDRAAVYAEVADRLATDAEQGDKDGLTRIYRRSAARQVRDWADELAREAQPLCAECDHPADAHRPGDDPVTPGVCGVCDPDDAHHDYVAGREARQEPTQDGEDTFAPWLAQRFDPQGAPWDGMSDDDRSYWEHQARAVRRAVARGGFKRTETATAQSGQPETDEEACPGFPDRCPNLRTVEPNPPARGGGVRCGCGAEPAAPPL